jgi:hypothetical protein
MSNRTEILSAIEPLVDDIIALERRVDDAIAPAESFIKRAKQAVELAELTIESQSAMAEMLLKGLSHSLESETRVISAGNSKIFRK